MKIIILIIALLSLASLNACCQSEKEVPEAVKSAFAEKFPDAKKIKWGMENKTEWEAEFMMNGKEYSTNYNIDGAWMETEYEINQNEIPAIIKATLGSEFIGYSINESEISETGNGKVYEFELKKGSEKKEVAIDMNGKVVKKAEAIEGDDKEDDD